MIYIHTYGVGKFGKEIRRTVHENKESAEFAQKVLGGELKAYRESDTNDKINRIIEEGRK